MKFEIIPERTLLEDGIPIKAISDLAKIEGNSKKPVYSIHKWWARRLSSVVRGIILGAVLPDSTTEEQFWDIYYQQNILDNITVLDTFMGGGTCVVEARKMGAHVIGVDIDPLACFITKKEVESLERKELEDVFTQILLTVEKQVNKYYLTKVNEIIYEVINFFWAYELKCDKCMESIITQPHYYLAKDSKIITVFCKHCGEVHELPVNRKRFRCTKCNKTTDIYNGNYNNGKVKCCKCGESHTLIKHVKGAKSLKLFAIEYLTEGTRKYKKADESDIFLFDEAKKSYTRVFEELPVPDDIIPSSRSGETRPQSHGYLFYKDLFNSRQLLSLGLLLKEILSVDNHKLREWLLLAFSDCLAANNMLCCYAYGYKKLTPLFGIHAYTVPVRVAENNVLGTKSLGRGSFKKTFSKMLKGKQYCDETYEVTLSQDGKKDKLTTQKIKTGEKISAKIAKDAKGFYIEKRQALFLNQSSVDLNVINNNSIEIILTDPPYYDNLAYSELSAFYFAWLKKHISFNDSDQYDNSIFMKGNDLAEYKAYVKQLSEVFRQCYKKLKSTGIMIFSFHHNKIEAWIALAKSIKNSGFCITKVFPIRSEGNSAYHSSEKSIKWDSIIILRKEKILVNKTQYYDEIEFCVNELDMKECDLISFYRSLKLQDYVNNIGELQDDNLNVFLNKGISIISEIIIAKEKRDAKN